MKTEALIAALERAAIVIADGSLRDRTQYAVKRMVERHRDNSLVGLGHLGDLVLLFLRIAAVDPKKPDDIDGTATRHLYLDAIEWLGDYNRNPFLQYGTGDHASQYDEEGRRVPDQRMVEKYKANLLTIVDRETLKWTETNQTAKYLDWVARHIEEMWDGWDTAATMWEKIRRLYFALVYLDGPYKKVKTGIKDINQFKTVDQLITTMEQASKDEAVKQIDTLMDSPPWRVLRPKTKEALSILTPKDPSGVGYWCVGRLGQAHYETYMNNGKNPFFVVFQQEGNPRSPWLAYFADGTLTEVKDNKDHEPEGSLDIAVMKQVARGLSQNVPDSHLRMNRRVHDVVGTFCTDTVVDMNRLRSEVQGLNQDADFDALLNQLSTGYDQYTMRQLIEEISLDGGRSFDLAFMARTSLTVLSGMVERYLGPVDGDVYDVFISRIERGWSDANISVTNFPRCVKESFSQKKSVFPARNFVAFKGDEHYSVSLGCLFLTVHGDEVEVKVR